MQRRQVVRALGLLAVGSAGCSEAPSPTPAPPTGTPGDPDGGNTGGLTTRKPLRVENDYTITEGPNGNVLIEATVTNPASVDRTATMRVDASLDGEDTVQRKQLDLASGESTDVSIVLDYRYEDWQAGSFSIGFNFEYV
jgi:hypothetical protein